MVVPIRLANSTWRGLLTAMPVRAWFPLIAISGFQLNVRCFRFSMLTRPRRPISVNLIWNVFLQNSHKIVILRACDLIQVF